MTTKSRARRSAEKYADELIELIRRGFPEAEFELYRRGAGEYDLDVYGEFEVVPGQKFGTTFQSGFPGRWVRLKSNLDCTASATFLYE